MKNMLTKFRYRGLDDTRAYYNQDYRNFVANHRASFSTLTEALLLEGKTEEAREALLFCFDKMPDKTIAYDHYNARMVEALFEVGEKEKALEVANTMWPKAETTALYLAEEKDFSREFQISYAVLNELQRVLYKYGEADLGKKVEESYERINTALNIKDPERSGF